MPISSTTNRVSYTGNGVTTAFSFPYYFLADADLVVVETIIATGVQTIKTITTHYTVSGAADPAGGTVTAVSAPAGTVTWTIIRDPAITQTVDLVDNDPLPVASIETPLDRLTMIGQRLKDRIDRTLRQPDGDAAAIAAIPSKVARAGKVAAYDPTTGDPVVTDIDAADLDSLGDAPDLAAASAAAAATSETNAGASATSAAASAATALAAVGSVKVSSNDTTPSHLEAKLLVSGGGLSLSTQNDGGNETRTIVSTARKQGLETIWVPAVAMYPATTNGAATASIDSGSENVEYKVLDFDTSTQEFACFSVRFPKSWNRGTVTFAPYWTAASGSGGVVFAVQGVSLSDDDAINTAYGTEQTSTDTLITAADVHVGPTSAAITIAGTPAVGDLVFLRIKRNVSDGSDTLGVDARLLGIVLFFTTDASDDT